MQLGLWRVGVAIRVRVKVGCSFSLLVNNTAISLISTCPKLAFKFNGETSNCCIVLFVISILVVNIAHSQLSPLSCPVTSPTLFSNLFANKFWTSPLTNNQRARHHPVAFLPSFLLSINPPPPTSTAPSLSLWDLPPQSHKSTEDRCLLCLIKALPPGVIPQFEQEEKPSEGVWRGGWEV